MKAAFITGITGQCGSYLAELLLEKGYTVHGMIRRSSNFNTSRIDHIFDKLHLYHGDMTDISSIIHILEQLKGYERIEIYNLAAQSHVKVSFDNPLYTAQVDAIGTLNLLEAVRITGLIDKARIYQASTSEMYGQVVEIPQKETTPFYPRSPYGVAKVYAYWISKNYKESYGMYVCNGILFNNESSRRAPTFVTKKITMGIAKMLKNEVECITLGNLDSKRDWGYSKEYCEGMYLMLQADEPDDYVLATGETHSVREFVEEAFKIVGIEIEWQGQGLNEIGIDKKSGKTLIKIDEKYFRPAEVDFLLGDATKAKEKLGWIPKTGFKELVKIMVEGDLTR